MWPRLASVGFVGAAIGGTAVWFGLQEGVEPANPRPMPRQAFEPSVDSSAAVQARRTLAEIGLNPHDFQRNAELFELLANTGRGEVEALLAEVETLVSTPHRYDVARAIYTRFTEVDPEAAADHVAAVNYHSSWLAAVFRAWAHTDLDAAVDRAATLADDAKAIAAEAILGLDLPLPQRQDIARRLDSEVALAAISARDALAAASNDFAAAWRIALQGVDMSREPRTASEMQGMIGIFAKVGLLARRWAGHDPAAAMAAIGSVGNETIEMMARGAAFEVWAADDPSGAIAWLAEPGSVRNRDSLVQVLMRELVQDDLGEAIRMLDTMPDSLRPGAGVGLVRAMRGRDTSDLDFQMLLDWYDALESPSDRLGSELARSYAARDPQKAFAWAQTLEGRAGRDAVGMAVIQLARSDPALAKRLVTEIEDPRLRQRAAQQFVSAAARNDPRETLRWAQSFPAEDDRPQLVGRALSAWSRESPRDAALEVLSMRDVQLRDDVAHTVAWAAAERGHAELAAELFEAVESEDARKRVATVLLRYHTQIEPDEDKAEFYRSIAPERVPRPRQLR